MKRLFSRLWILIGLALINGLAAIRFILELVGYATLPDDAREAHGLLSVLADMALALPWWAIWWPLFISYIFAAGVAFDFSFDLFKREPKPKTMTKLEKLASFSSQFIKEFSNVNSEYFTFGSDQYEAAAMSMVEIFRERLTEFGIEGLHEKRKLAEDIVQLKTLISRYMPYLIEGDYDKAISTARETVSNLNRK